MAWFQVSFFSECLSRSVPLNVVVPADLFGPPELVKKPDKYKTLYLLHGYFGDRNDWLLNARVQEMSQQFNLAIVMMSGNNGFYVDQPKTGIRGSEFIGRELVEFTRKIFPLSDKREDTIIGGLSMGGYGTLYNAMKHSEVFGYAIALSTPISAQRVLDTSTEPPELGLHADYYETLHGDLTKLEESDRNLEVLARTIIDSGRELPELYIACGYNDMLAVDNREFCAHLKSINFPYVYEEGPGTHEWPFWNEFLFKGLCHVLPEGPTVFPNPFWVDYEPMREGAV